MKKLCPKCHKNYINKPAISREDNKTEICSICGQIEAFVDYIKHSNELTRSKKKEMIEVITRRLAEADEEYRKNKKVAKNSQKGAV